MPSFSSPPPSAQYALLSFPAPYVLLVTLNRPRDLNCMNSQGQSELRDVLEWMDDEPSLRVGILTGKGRAFCTGADLKEWNKNAQSNTPKAPVTTSGFGGLSRRKGRKPVLCAVNGLCFGGGTEMMINSDLVIAASHVSLSLPEVKRGVVALAGALPRLVRTVGKQRATEMVLTGRAYTAQQAERWGLINEVLDVDDCIGAGGKLDDDAVSKKVVERAVQVASEIAGNSPDAVLISREGINLGWEGIGAEEGTVMLNDTWVRRLYEGDNMKEGLKAFVEKREPDWKDSRL